MDPSAQNVSPADNFSPPPVIPRLLVRNNGLSSSYLNCLIDRCALRFLNTHTLKHALSADGQLIFLRLNFPLKRQAAHPAFISYTATFYQSLSFPYTHRGEMEAGGSMNLSQADTSYRYTASQHIELQPLSFICFPRNI